MSTIYSNIFTSIVPIESTPSDEEVVIYSNTFISTIARESTPSDEEVVIYSSEFTCTVARIEIQETDKNTKVIVYKGTTELIPVKDTPSVGQYKVDIIDVSNCNAKLEEDNKTITLLYTYSNSAKINIAINIENKNTYYKTIPVASITDSSVINETYTKYEQLSNKFSWIVKNGTSSSNMELTDSFYSVLTENIKLSANNIELEGLVTANDNFKINTDGTCEVKDLIVTGSISANGLTSQLVNLPGYSRCLTENISVYIREGYTYNKTLAEDYFEDGAYFANFSDLLSVCPNNLNGYTLDVFMDTDLSENIKIDNLCSGKLRIHMQGHSINGYIKVSGSSVAYELFGNKSSQIASDIRGKIIPGASGYSYDDYKYCFFVDQSKFKIHDVDFYNGTSSTIGIGSRYGAVGYISNVKAINKPLNLIRIAQMSHMYVKNSYGLCSSYSFVSVSGSIIHLNDTNQAGRESGSDHTYTMDNSVIYSDGVTFDSNNIEDSTPSNPPENTEVVKTSIIKSKGGNSWRLNGNYANTWATDAVVRQGRWTTAYGHNQGYWWFGNELYNILQNPNNTITSLKIKISRLSGGTSASVTHYLKAHKHSSKPSSPVLSNILSKSFNLAVGNSATISLSSSEISSLISNKIKGFGLYTTDATAGANGSYSNCSPTATVTITYKTTESE